MIEGTGEAEAWLLEDTGDANAGCVRVLRQPSEVNAAAATTPMTRSGTTQPFQPLQDIMKRKLAAIKRAIVSRRRKKYCAMRGG
jgi:hypothetical protein